MNKKNNLIWISSLFSLLIGLLLMIYLRKVYFVGLIIYFIIIAFQTPTTKVDRTGEANEASIAMLKFTGLNSIMFLIGGYLSLLFFS